MRRFKTGVYLLMLLLVLGCRVTFSPVLKTSLIIETNVNIREKDTIKKHHKTVKPLKQEP